MLTIFIQLVLVVFSAKAQPKVEQACNPFYNHGNSKLAGHVIKKLKTTTDTHCIDECKLNNKCYSINHHHGNGVWELNEANHLSKPESLVHAMGYQYVSYHHRKPVNCSNNFCPSKLDTCLIEDNGKDYRCVSCKDQYTGHQEILLFPRQAIEDKVVLENFFETALTSFTVSIWAQGADADHMQLFGLASGPQGNEISLALNPTIVKYNFRRSVSNFQIQYSHLSKWHHYLITWENVGGNVSIYIDGVFTRSKVLGVGSTVRKGALMLGQDQDSYMGDLQAKQAFQGNMTNMNMWDRVLTSKEITALSQSCTSGGEGNILKWSDLKDKGEGQVTGICSDACL